MPPTDRASPVAIGALLPDAIPPVRGQVSPQKYRRGYIPKTYASSDVDEARRVIKAWNECFAGVKGAYRANPGDACNIKAYVRMKQLAAKSDGLFNITEREACAAIRAYRADRYNVELGRWKRFADWCTCENIDAKAGDARVSAHQATQPTAAQKQKDSRTAAARKIVHHRRLVDQLVGWSNKYPKSPVFPAGKIKAHLPAVLDVTERWNALEDGPRVALSNRARKCFDAYFMRPFGKDRADPARLLGIALALLDLDRQAGATPQKEPTP